MTFMHIGLSQGWKATLPKFLASMIPETIKDLEGWHLDKKVPLSLIFAMLAQAGAIIWTVADIRKDVEMLKKDVAAQYARDLAQDIRVVEVQKLMLEQLNRMDTKLDRVIERDLDRGRGSRQ